MRLWDYLLVWTMWHKIIQYNYNINTLLHVTPISCQQIENLATPPHWSCCCWDKTWILSDSSHLFTKSRGNSLQKGATIGHRMCMGKHTHFSYQCDELKHRYGWQLNNIYFDVWEAFSLNKISTNLSLFQTIL